jgi:hypothetical protein
MATTAEIVGSANRAMADAKVANKAEVLIFRNRKCMVFMLA